MIPQGAHFGGNSGAQLSSGGQRAGMCVLWPRRPELLAGAVTELSRGAMWLEVPGSSEDTQPPQPGGGLPHRRVSPGRPTWAPAAHSLNPSLMLTVQEKCYASHTDGIFWFYSKKKQGKLILMMYFN